MRKTFTTDQVIEILQAKVECFGVRATAREVQMDPTHLSRIVRGIEPLTEAIAAKFGFVTEVTIRYRKAA